ncbi:MAG TPA: allophanate hydrolase [Baekduia sp.]|uniref:allophanate hydrolase n=1 Tax=Baekduia sp. TaxID=2600305 RepID=UPI002C4F1C03|nr:allophanate hydrolase [Baekduia sp.]HMJ35124.1 allophanate hydrolase [Baekduia sp.]
MSAVEAVRAAYARIAADDRPEVWITLRAERDVVAEAALLDADPVRSALPLAGMTVAVKDNIDVAGLPTTAGCPAFAYTPRESAPAVARLVAAGAIVLGKTNLDQFATGLVGTRSPHGAARDARRPEYVSGGSSSGSAVAVALGLVDLALGTDTAGSGRVPAAFGGIVGFKATRGIVPVRGVVPACRTLDCVTVLAADLAGAERAMAIMAGPDAADPLSRPWPVDAPLAAPPAPRVAVPAADQLGALTPAARDAFASAATRLADAGAHLRTIDLAPFLEAARLLYDGALVAERHAAVGAFVDAHPDDVDPTVGAIVRAAGRVGATAYLADGERVERLRVKAMAALGDADALLLPTTTAQPTIAEVAADPIGVNGRLGIYTNFCNLFDLCGVAVPAGQADGGRFGVTVLARAFGDRVAADVAALVTGTPPAPPADALGSPAVALLVVGAHRRGQPLNHQLTERGARFVATVDTAPAYRMYALDTEPPKPGLVRVDDGGEPIEGELWQLPPAALGTFLAALPAPMVLGPVRLADGGTVVGFGCEPVAVVGAPDITHHRSWPAYLASATPVG